MYVVSGKLVSKHYNYHEFAPSIHNPKFDKKFNQIATLR